MCTILFAVLVMWTTIGIAKTSIKTMMEAAP